MFIVTVKSIDADSLALPTLYGKTTLQNYNFSVNPQGEGAKIFFFQWVIKCQRVVVLIGHYGDQLEMRTMNELELRKAQILNFNIPRNAIQCTTSPDRLQ